MKTGSLKIVALAALALCLVSAVSVSAQRTTTRRRTTTTPAPAASPTPPAGAVEEETDATPQASPTPAARRARRTPAQSAADASARQVRAAFDALIDGISRADVEAVTGVYWNSPQLLLFNYNGTTTRTWAQVRANRESSYPNIKDAKVAVRDVRVQMLGADAALVTCLWTQSQVFKGQPETSSGRLTLVFRRLAGEWKAVHTHTSPDSPDPSRIPASEQTTAAPAPSPTPARP